MNVFVKQTRSYSVRQIETVDDIDGVMQLSPLFGAEVSDHEEVDLECVLRTCVQIKCSDRTHTNLFIVYKYDLPVGFLVGTCFDLWYNTRKCAEQKLWFVLKEHRHTIAPKLLIDAYEAWALSLGASRIYTGCANPHYAETISRTLSKLGYTHVGGTFVKEFE